MKKLKEDCISILTDGIESTTSNLNAEYIEAKRKSLNQQLTASNGGLKENLHAANFTNEALKDFDKASVWYEYIINIAYNNASSVQNSAYLAEAAYHLAWIKLNNYDYTNAENYFLKSANSGNNKYATKSTLYLGMLYEELGNFESAEKFYSNIRVNSGPGLQHIQNYALHRLALLSLWSRYDGLRDAADYLSRISLDSPYSAAKHNEATFNMYLISNFSKGNTFNRITRPRPSIASVIREPLSIIWFTKFAGTMTFKLGERALPRRIANTVKDCKKDFGITYNSNRSFGGKLFEYTLCVLIYLVALASLSAAYGLLQTTNFIINKFLPESYHFLIRFGKNTFNLGAKINIWKGSQLQLDCGFILSDDALNLNPVGFFAAKDFERAILQSLPLGLVKQTMIGCHSVNQREQKDGNTMLHLIASGVNIDLMRFFIKKPNTDLRLLNNKGESVLDVALLKSTTEMQELIFEQFKNLENSNRLKKYLWKLNDFKNLMVLLMFKRANIKQGRMSYSYMHTDSTLLYAIHREKLDVLDWVLPRYTRQDIKKKMRAQDNSVISPFEAACQLENTANKKEIVKMLRVFGGIHYSADDLMACIRGRDVEQCREIIANCNVKNLNSNALLDAAIESRDPIIVSMIIEACSDNLQINGVDNTNAPLISACLNGTLEIVRMLIARHGLDINKKISNAQFENATALWIAAYLGHEAIVFKLLDSFRNEINLNILTKICGNDQVDTTPEQIARRLNHLDIAELICAAQTNNIDPEPAVPMLLGERRRTRGMRAAQNEDEYATDGNRNTIRPVF